MKLDILFVKPLIAGDAESNRKPSAALPLFLPTRKVQTEVVLLLRVIDLMRVSDSITRSLQYCSSLTKVMESASPLSLSAHWSSVFPGFTSLVQPDTQLSGSVLNFPELRFLEPDSNTACKSLADAVHDPMGVVKTLVDFLEEVLTRAPNADKHLPLMTLFLLGIKSGRISILLRVLLLSLKYKIQLETCVVTVLKDACALMQSSTIRGSVVALPRKQSRLEALIHSPSHEVTAQLLREKYDSTRRSSFEDSCRRGLLLSFGKADHGKLGHGDSLIHRSLPTIVESLQDIRVAKVASMSTYTLAINSDGVPFVWGTGGSTGATQALRTDVFPQMLDALPSSVKVRDVSCGLGHALFLTDSGRVFSWGNGGNGRLGLGDVNDRSEASFVEGVAHCFISFIQAGASHSLALSSTGGLWTWGKNSQGQCGCGTNDDVLRPVLVSVNGEVVKEVAAGWEHTLALTFRGAVYAWGCGYKDSRRGIIPPVLGIGSSEAKSSPERLPSLDSVVVTSVACGWDHCLALSASGKVYSWGSGQNGKLGHNTENNCSVPTPIESLGSLLIAGISAGCEHSAVVDVDGKVYTFGHGDGGRLGHGESSQCMIPTLVTTLCEMKLKATTVHCGDKFTIVLADEGLVIGVSKGEQEQVLDAADDGPSFLSDGSEITQRVTVSMLNQMILSLCSSVCSTSSDSQHWPLSVECSVETLNSLLLLLENQAEVLANFESSGSPALLNETLKSFESASVFDADAWRSRECLIRLVEANITAFIRLNDSVAPSGASAPVDRAVPVDEVPTIAASTSAVLVVDSRSDFNEDVSDLLEGGQTKSLNMLESNESIHQFSNRNSPNRQNSVGHEFDDRGRMSPALSNASFDASEFYDESLEDSNTLEESEVDLQYSIQSDSANFGMPNETSEILPRYFDALCNIASSTYQHLSATKVFAEYRLPALRLWLKLQRTIGGPCSRAIFLPGELKRVLYECIISPADFVHISLALALALDSTPTLERDVIRGSSDELGMVPITFNQMISFGNYVLSNFTDGVSDASDTECHPKPVSRAYFHILFRFVMSLLVVYDTDIPLQDVHNGRQLLLNVAHAAQIEQRHFALNPQSDSQFVLIPALCDFFDSLETLPLSFHVVSMVLPCLLRLSEVFEEFGMHSSSDKKDDDKNNFRSILSILMRRALEMTGKYICFIIAKAQSGLSAFTSFELTTSNLIGLELLSDFPPEMHVSVKDTFELEFILSVNSSFLIREPVPVSDPISSMMIEALDRGIYGSPICCAIRKNVSLWTSLGVTSSDPCFSSVFTDISSYSIGSVHVLRSAILKFFVKSRNLLSLAVQTQAKLVLSDNATYAAAGIDADILNAWWSSFVISVVLVNLRAKGLCCALEEMLSRCGLLFLRSITSLNYLVIIDPIYSEENVVNSLVSSSSSLSVQKLRLALGCSHVLSLGLRSTSHTTSHKSATSVFDFAIFLGCESMHASDINLAQTWREMSDTLINYSLAAVHTVMRRTSSDPTLLDAFLVQFKLSRQSNNLPLLVPFLATRSVPVENCRNFLSDWIRCSSDFDSSSSFAGSVDFFCFMFGEALDAFGMSVLLGSIFQALHRCKEAWNVGLIEPQSEFLLSFKEVIEKCVKTFHKQSLRDDSSVYIFARADQVESIVAYCKAMTECCVELYQLLHQHVKSFSFSKVHIIASGIRSIERKSPSIYYGLSCSSGSFAIGFWLYVPSVRRNSPSKYLHLMSRVPDTLDVNIFALINGDLRSKCHPSISIRMEDGSFRMVVSTATSDSDIYSLESTALSYDAWTHCYIQFRQARPMKTGQDTANCSNLSLYINSTLIDSKDVPGFKFKLHHKLIVGTIPTDISSDKGVLISDLHFSANRKSQLDESPVVSEKLRHFVSASPPSAICVKLVFILHIIRLLLETIHIDLKMRNPLCLAFIRSHLDELRSLLLQTMSVGDEPLNHLSFEVLDMCIEESFASAAHADIAQEGFCSDLQSLVEMAYSFIDLQIDQRLDGASVSNRLWLERVCVNRENSHIAKHDLVARLWVNEGNFMSDISKLLRNASANNRLRLFDFLRGDDLDTIRIQLILATGDGWYLPLVSYAEVQLFPRNQMTDAGSVAFISHAKLVPLADASALGYLVLDCESLSSQNGLNPLPSKDNNSAVAEVNMLSEDPLYALDFHDLHKVIAQLRVISQTDLVLHLKKAANYPGEKYIVEDMNVSSINLFQQMSLLRCMFYNCLPHTRKASIENSFEFLGNVMNDLHNIFALASQDSLPSILAAFDLGKPNGSHVEVLKGLLRSEAISMEKLSLRMWRQVKRVVSDETDKSSFMVLAGDVQISPDGTSMRALSTFPSIRLTSNYLHKRTGRYYYEIEVLSEGLMQVGFADESFRCDPSSGQGVGDHLHSWAYDGLRSKKWNVACDSYGKRWHIGDIVGALLDTDLLEMKFYLNGEDLGPAFSNFSPSLPMFPALSLNIRQSVRVNIGHSRFMYPPEEIDGCAFKAVCQPIAALPSQVLKKSSTEKESSYDANPELYRNYGGSTMDSASGDSDDESDGENDGDEINQTDSLWPEDASARMNADEPVHGTEDSHEHDMRRQSLIENLIGMGFPVDWSLRAVENNDLLTEHACITWIIERMEMEQAKMEYDAQSRLGENDADEHTEGATSTKDASANAPGNIDGLDKGFVESALYTSNSWNDVFSYLSVSAGKEESDKQILFSQISNLDTQDLTPLICACCYTLAILYARYLSLQLMNIVCELFETKYSGEKINEGYSDEILNFYLTAYFSNASIIDSWKLIFDQFIANPFPSRIFSIQCAPALKPFMNPSTARLGSRMLELESTLLRSVRNSFMNMIAYQRPMHTLKGVWTLLLKLVHGEQREFENTSSISSSGEGYEEKMQRSLGLDTGDPLRSNAKKLLIALVDECVSVFEKAVSIKEVDWIVQDMDRERTSTEDRPRVLWSYWMLRTLILLESSILQHPSKFQSVILSAALIAKLVKLTVCQNVSLRFCLLDICALMLSRVNEQLRHLDNQTYELKLATEYYLSIVRDHGLINQVHSCLKAETSLAFTPSRSTSAAVNFLVQCQIMRKQLRLDTSSAITESFFNEYNDVLNCYLARSAVLTVNQIGPTSIHISWNLESQMREDTYKSQYVYFSLHAQSLSGGSSVMLLNCIDAAGQYRIEKLFPNSLYRIFIMRSNRKVADMLKDEPRTNESKNTIYYTDEENARSRSSGDDAVSSLCCSTDPEASFTLDAHWLPPNLKLLGSTTVKNVANKKWSTVRGTMKLMDGVHHWDVLIDRCVSKNIFIGVITPEARRENYVGCDRYGWAFLANRAIWHNKSKVKPYGELFRSGDVVSVTLDLDQGTLSYKLNAIDMGVAVTGLVGPLYAAFSLYNEDDQLTVAAPKESFGEYDACGVNSLDRCSVCVDRIVNRMEQSLLLVELLDCSDDCGLESKDNYCSDTRFCDVVQDLHKRIQLLRMGCTIRSLMLGNDMISVVASDEACLKFSSNRLNLYDEVALMESFGLLSDSKDLAQVIGISRHKIWLLHESGGKLYGLTKDSLSHVMSIGLLKVIRKHPISPVELGNSSSELSAFDDKVFLESQEHFRRSTGSFRFEQYDSVILTAVNALCRTNAAHPLKLSYVELRKLSFSLMISLPDIPAHAIFLRLMILIVFNDTAAPLFPFFVSPDLEFKQSLRIQDAMRRSLFFEVKRELVNSTGRCRRNVCGSMPSDSLFRVAFPSLKPVALMSESSRLSSPSKSYSNIEDDSNSIFVEDTALKLQSVVQEALAEGVLNKLLSSQRWRLLLGIQSSLIGRFQQYIRKSANDVLLAHTVLASMSWESALFEGVDALGTDGAKRVPFLVRLKPTEGVASSKILKSSLCQRLLDNRGNDWELFAEFTKEAFMEMQGFLNNLASDDAEELNAASLSMLLKILKSAGLLLGLAYTFGVSVSIELPEGFWEIITGIDYQYIASATKFHAVMAGSMRQGIASVLSEMALDILSPEDLKALLCGTM